MSTTNRTCVICCRPYHACKNCEDAAKLGNYRWRNSCDRPECFQVLLVLTDFYYGHIDKYKARELLTGILSDDMLPYDPQAKILIDQIYEEDPLPALTETTPEIAIAEEEQSVETVEATSEIVSTDDFVVADTSYETEPHFITNDEPETVVNEINYFDGIDGDI